MVQIARQTLLGEIMSNKIIFAVVFALSFLSFGIVADVVNSDNTVINKAVAGPGG